MTLIEYPDRDMLALRLADVFAGELDSFLARHERASFAVSGGSTPGPIFDSLCAADLEWNRIDILLTDERWVPETSERSNARMVRARLLTDRAAGARFIPFFTESETPQSAAEPLSETLAPVLPLSLVMLGMGGDMHTASLFPGAKGLAEGLAPDALALVAVEAEGQEPRISLSARALNDAMSKHLVITGTDKREALTLARDLPPEEAPIAAVLDDLTIHWAE